eukprot:527168-Rhodomonas_salina.1
MEKLCSATKDDANLVSPHAPRGQDRNQVTHSMPRPTAEFTRMTKCELFNPQIVGAAFGGILPPPSTQRERQWSPSSCGSSAALMMIAVY